MENIYLKTKKLLTIAVFLIATHVSVAQNTWYVNDNSTTGDIYTTAVGNDATNLANDPSKPSATLADAITSSANGDTIYVDKGTWEVRNSTINKGVTIIGAGTGNTIYDGGSSQGNFATISVNNVKISNVQFRSYEASLSNTSSIITVNSNVTGIVLSNIIINLNGNHSGVGQSLVLQSGSHVTYNNSFTKCNGDISANGGGVRVNSATLIVNNCLFFNNEWEAGDGGAIRVDGTSNVTINNSTFTGNKGQSGGAIAQYGGTLNVNGSCFTDNESTTANSEDGGGAIYVTGTSNTTFSNCTFDYNRAANNGVGSGTPDGGSFKFHNVTGTASITNCSFSNGFKLLNGTVLNGGLGQYIYYNSAALNITISNNSFSTSNSGEVNIFEEGAGNQTMSNNGIYTQSGSTSATTNATPQRTDVSGFGTWTDTNIGGTTTLNMLSGIVAFTPSRGANAGFGTWTDTDLGGTASITFINPNTTSYTPIRTDNTGFATWTDTSITGTITMTMQSSTSKIESPVLDLSLGNVKTISFSLGRGGLSNATPCVVTISISTDGGATWSSLGTKVNNSTTATTQTIDISSFSSNNVKIKFESLAANTTTFPFIDNINILRRVNSTTITPTLDFTGHTTKTLNMQIAAVSSVSAPKNTITISGSTDNGATWSVLDTRVPATTVLAAIAPLDLSSLSGSTVKLKFESLASDGTIGGQLDNINITGETKISSTISPTLDLTGNTAQVSYVHANIGSNATKNTVTVSVSNDNGATWTSIGTSNTAGTKTFDLGNNLTNQVKVKFEALSADGIIGASIETIDILKATFANAAPLTSCIPTTSITACGATVTCSTETNPPVIIRCVENKTITDCSGTLPNYTSELSAFDDCTFTVTQSPAPGTSLATLGNGNHTITFTVSDQSPNSADTTCTMTLTLSGCAGCSIKTWTLGAWSPAGTPTTANEVVIDDTYNTTTHGNIECCKLTVNVGKTLTITGDMYALVVNEVINNGTFTIENNGSLVQQDNTKTNTGNVIYKRTAKARNSDYVYWSSPVASYALSGHVATGPKYIWDTTAANANGTQGAWGAAPATLGLAQGVIVRGNADFSDVTTTINDFENTFTGVPNNGIITKQISRGNLQGSGTTTGNATITAIDDNHNLIGNPYASAISAKDFLTLNSANLTGALQIWTHGTLVGNNGQSFYQNFSNSYSANDYVSYNLSGTTFSPGTDYNIGAGQGFFVAMVDGATASTVNVTFNNAMRRTTGNSSTSATPNFFRNSSSQNQASKFWIDLVADNGVSSRSLVAYVEGATNQKDNLHDAITKPQGNLLLYSKLGEDRLNIQGKGLPFEDEDQVPMGYFAPAAGNYTLALAFVEGTFSNGQTIYVKDNLLNTYHNLSLNPYLFNTQAGENQNRFVIVYKTTLGNDNFSTVDVSIYVNDVISIKSNETIESIQIFDVLGKEIKKYENLSTTSFQDDFNLSNGVYIVKLKTDKNNTISKKVLK